MPGLSGRSGLEIAWNGEADDHVIALQWSRDGSMLAAASVTGPIAIFDGQAGRIITRLPGHGFGTTDLSWNHDGTLLASSGQDGTARIWSIPAGPERSRLEAGSAWVEHVSCSPTGRFLATAAGKKLRIWDEQGTRIIASRDTTTTIAAIAWQPDSDVLAVASYGRLEVIDPESDRSTRVFEWKGSMLAIAWNPDGRTIASGDQDASAHLWDVETGESLRMWGYQTKVRQLSWDRSGRYLATGGGPQVTIWDRSGVGLQGSEPIALRNRPAATVSSVAFEPDGVVLASGDLEGAVALWEVGKISGRLANRQLGSEITQLRWHPKAKQLAAGTAAGGVFVFDHGP